MTIPANFDDMWQELPQWFQANKQPVDLPTYKVFPQIPDLRIPVDWETCCIQMSHAFNQVGLTIDYFDKQRVLKNAGGLEYLLDVAEMREYLTQHYGEPQNVARVDAAGSLIPRIATEAVLDGRQGVIAFGNRHIDLWNGSRIHGEAYILEALWDGPSAKQWGVFFWDVTL